MPLGLEDFLKPKEASDTRGIQDGRASLLSVGDGAHRRQIVSSDFERIVANSKKLFADVIHELCIINLHEF